MLRESFRRAPRELRAAAVSRLPRLETLLVQHPQALDGFQGSAITAWKLSVRLSAMPQLRKFS